MKDPIPLHNPTFPYVALPIALVICFLSILPYFGLHFDYIPGDFGDNRLNNYLLEHGYKWITGQTPGSFFDAPFYYPARASIRFADNHLGGLPFYVPWRLFGFDREATFQIWIVLGYLLNYLSAAWVLYKLRFHWFAVLSGAYVFAFSQVALTHSWHIQLHYRFAIPLAWYFLHLFLQDFKSKHLAASLAFVAWQFYSSIYEGYFLGLFLSAFALVKVCTSPIVRRYIRNAKIRTAAAHILIVLGFVMVVGVLAAVYVPSATDARLMAARRPEVISMLPRPVSYLVSFIGSSETGWLYNKIDLPMKHEHVMFVGLIPWLAVLVLLITARRAGRHPGVMPALLALFLIIGLTLFWHGHSIYFLLMNLPGINGIRGVSRVIMILLLPFSIATAQILHLCLERLRNARTAALAAFLVVVTVGLIMENRTKPYRYMKQEARERIQALASQLPARLPRNAVLAYLYPLGNDWVLNEVDAMLASQEKNISTMNGYGTASPDGFRYLHTCGDIKLTLDEIALNNESFSTQDAASEVVVIGTPVDAPCTAYLTRKATTAMEPLPPKAFRAKLEVTAPPAINRNSEFLSQVRITNQSDVLWRARGLPPLGKFALRVSCQWLVPETQTVLMGYPNRFDLPYDLQPDETASMAVLLTAPNEPGIYGIECDAVQELVAWFNLMGSSTGKTLVGVRRDPAHSSVATVSPSAIQAFLDVVDANLIGGWARDLNHLDIPLQIEIRDGDNPLTTVVANRFRKDLLDAGIGTGSYMFSIPNPVHADGKTHIIHVFVSGTNIELTGSPKAYTPKP